jgi:hypothetical protein
VIMRNTSLAVLGFVFFGGNLQSDVYADGSLQGSLKPQDFAFGMAIDAPSGGPVFKLSLSEEVYRGVKGGDLRDLRVFNSQGEVVPHSLEHKTFQELEETARHPILMFPIDGAPAKLPSRSELELKEDASGRVVHVRFSGQETGSSQPTRAYLLDLRKQDQKLKGLDFEWSPAEPNRMVPILVEASDDLKYWRPLTSGAVLARLAYQGETLERKRVEFPEVRSSFLRITWDGDTPLRLTSISGEFVSGKKLDAVRSWTRVSGRLRSPANPSASASAAGEEFIFGTQSSLPVDSIQVLLPETNTFIRLRLSSADTEDGPWVERFAGTVYRMTVEGKEIVSLPIQLRSFVADRYWVFRIEGKESSWGGKAPELELGWVPHRLLFLARGDAPFRLAYGSAVVGRTDFGFASLMESLNAANDAQTVVPQEAQLVGGQMELGGATRLATPPEVKPLAWKQWALWAILVFALVLVAGMAWKLYRELSTQAS